METVHRFRTVRREETMIQEVWWRLTSVFRKESDPPPCDHEIYQHGQYVAALYGRSVDIEEWVRSVAKQTGARLDWHMVGGRSRVLYLGDDQGKNAVIEKMNELAPQLRGRILDMEVARNS
jgi:hypothetical protein